MKTLQSILILCTSILLFNCSNSTSSSADELRAEVNNPDKNMYVIERDIPGAGQLTADELQGISQTSCSVLDNLGEDNIEWLHSYVTNDKVYCVYMATNLDMVKEHAKQGGFPANSIAKVGTVIDPSTAN